MNGTLATEPLVLPLTLLENGAYRVTGTRIPLERIIECYKASLSPEEIVDAYDSLQLSDVYTLIGYYLNHTEDVENYLRRQEQDAEEVRRLIEQTMPPRPGFREELLRRKALREKGDASAGN